MTTMVAYVVVETAIVADNDTAATAAAAAES